MSKKLEADGSDIGNRTLEIVKNRYGLSDWEEPLHFDGQNAIFTRGHRITPLPLTLPAPASNLSLAYEVKNET